ncbi:hypothetical protein, partial [Escherichia coli]
SAFLFESRAAPGLANTGLFTLSVIHIFPPRDCHVELNWALPLRGRSAVLRIEPLRVSPLRAAATNASGLRPPRFACDDI